MAMVSFAGSIAGTRGALRRSGGIEGGATVTLEIPEKYIDAYKALCDLVGKPLVVVIKEMTFDDAEEES